MIIFLFYFECDLRFDSYTCARTLLRDEKKNILKILRLRGGKHDDDSLGVGGDRSRALFLLFLGGGGVRSGDLHGLGGGGLGGLRRRLRGRGGGGLRLFLRSLGFLFVKHLSLSLIRAHVRTNV